MKRAFFPIQRNQSKTPYCVAIEQGYDHSLLYRLRETQYLTRCINNNKNFYNFMNTTEAPWQKMNTFPVCFGAKDDQFGEFEVEIGGSVDSVKLVHISGDVTCAWFPGFANAWSKFGCHKSSSELFTFITTANNDILLPESREFPSRYTLQGYHPDSTEIVFTNILNPLRLSSGQQLRVWYGDLVDESEYDNSGSTCVDVYAKYKWNHSKVTMYSTVTFKELQIRVLLLVQGELSHERVGDARGKIWIKRLEETNLGLARALFDP